MMRLVLSLSGDLDPLRVERAIAEFRSARPVLIEGTDAGVLVLGVEGFDALPSRCLEAAANHPAGEFLHVYQDSPGWAHLHRRAAIQAGRQRGIEGIDRCAVGHGGLQRFRAHNEWRCMHPDQSRD